MRTKLDTCGLVQTAESIQGALSKERFCTATCTASHPVEMREYEEGRVGSSRCVKCELSVRLAILNIAGSSGHPFGHPSAWTDADRHGLAWNRIRRNAPDMD